jgi:hypothetical protein
LKVGIFCGRDSYLLFPEYFLHSNNFEIIQFYIFRFNDYKCGKNRIISKEFLFLKSSLFYFKFDSLMGLTFCDVLLFCNLWKNKINNSYLKLHVFLDELQGNTCFRKSRGGKKNYLWRQLSSFTKVNRNLSSKNRRHV